MAQAYAFGVEQEDGGADQTVVARRSLWLAWAAFALLAALLVFPLRYSAHAELSFNVAAQPTASAVRGNIQLLSSRELAFDVTQALGQTDTAALAAQALPRLSALWRQPDMDPAAVRDRAARTLAGALEVSAQQNGRLLDIAVSLPDGALAARVANAYAGTLLALDASVRHPADGPSDVSPPLRLATPASATRMPDLPQPGALILLAIGSGLMGMLIFHLRHRAPRATGQVASCVLPQPAPDERRVSWLRSTGGIGLAPDAAVDRLVATTGTAATTGLVILTSPDLPEETAACSLALARRLAETEDQVVLVALDGQARAFSRLTADPRAPGVAEMLFGVAGFSEAIHRDPGSRAHIVPPGRDARGGDSVVGAERLPLILQALCRTYSRVIVAAPNLAGAAGAERIAGLSPLLIALHEEDTSTSQAVETYDALAAKGFSSVVMLPMSFTPEEQAPDQILPADAEPVLPVPTLMTPAAEPTSRAA
ncbi:hypothetical protein ACLBXM_06805 [Xanthobacteraceae bacterium A53D]